MITKISFNLSRVFDHYQHKDFAILSAYRKDLSEDENLKRHEQLKNFLREDGYGWKEVRGVYKDKEGETTIENGVFVPNLHPEVAIELGKYFNQEAIIFADGEQIYLYFIADGETLTWDKMESNFKDSWEAWSDYKGKEFKYASVEWHMATPPEKPLSWAGALIKEAYYKRDDIRYNFK